MNKESNVVRLAFQIFYGSITELKEMQNEERIADYESKTQLLTTLPIFISCNK